jgi:beta-lactamase superfamily II metal-dependent hydrolase
MRRVRPLACLLFCTVALLSGSFAKSGKPLTVYFIDVEGGQATLFVTPTHSMLIDTGWPGDDARDAGRIISAAKQAGLKQLDYVVITHYHHDHVGGVPELAKRFKIGTFVDHGPNQEDSDVTRTDYAAYQQAITHAKHITVKPGDQVPVKGIKVTVLTAAGDRIPSALPGAGQPNPLCAPEPTPETDNSENARSVGLLVTYGEFRLLDLGDLTKKKELELACPSMIIPTVNVLVTTHHGFNQSNPKPLIWGVHPKVAITDNGAHKGGSPEVFDIVHSSPGLEDIWQLHTALDAGKDHNTTDQFIANPTEENDAAQMIKLTAEPDGTFTVVNTRNGFQKSYR